MHFKFTRPGASTLARTVIVVATGALFVGWLAQTPAGILGKADAIGFAVCHRIPIRSFFFDERQLPLCARCSGMYLGALAGIVYHMLAARRKGNLPALKITVALLLLAAAFAVDGVNSYIGFWGVEHRVYQSHNILRLFSGTGLGIGMSALLMPVFNQTTWQDWQAEPALHSWKQLGLLLLAAALLDAMVLSELPILLYPLALLSSGTILFILSLVYAMVWMMALKRENRFKNWKEAGWMLFYGFATALLQIVVMDVIRLRLTGGWSGYFINVP